MKSITIRSVASYDSVGCNIEDLKTVNLFYGMNGADKSTIANYLAAPDDQDFLHCSFDSKTPKPEFFVYNQRFIDSNFHSADEHNGIFTLGEKDIIAEAAIKAAESAIERKQSTISSLEGDIDIIEASIQAEQNNSTQRAWDIKKTLDQFLQLRELLTGYHADKTKFFNELAKHDNSQSTQTPQDINNQLTELKNTGDIELSPLSKISYSDAEIISDPIWQMSVRGATDSYLSKLISKLNAQSWFKQGLTLSEKSEGACPFCQQDLPNNFHTEAESIFDHAYLDSMNTIAKRRSEFMLKAQSPQAALHNYPEHLTKSSEWIKACASLQKAIERITSDIQKKETKPEDSITLTSLIDQIDPINNIIEAENTETTKNNSIINGKKTILQHAKIQLWAYLAAATKEFRDELNKSTQKLREDANQSKAMIATLKQEIRHQTEIMAENQAKLTNTDTSIQKINQNIKAMGITGFKISKSPTNNHRYRLSRDKGGSNVFKTLSEGEKTLITFLYFLELIKGTTKNQNTIKTKNRCIVIDDPISSLSNNYVYEIATLIQREVIASNQFRQTLILTHNLYFYHELIKQAKGLKTNYSLYRVAKTPSTKIQQITKDEIKNSYEAYWDSLRLMKDAQAPSNYAPNTMRNILENFFGFTKGEEKLDESLNALASEDTSFTSFYRYINRCSHSDAINLTYDYGAISIDTYIEKFEQVFKRAGYHDHYKAMMRIETPD